MKPARWHDDLCTPHMNRPVETLGIASAVTSDIRQRLCRLQLRQQFFCLSGITLSVIGHLHYPDIQGGGINDPMDLAPCLAVAGAMPFDLPLSLAANLEAGAVDRRCNSSARHRTGMLTVKVACCRLTVLKQGSSQSSPGSFNRLQTKPLACRKPSLNNTFSVSTA